MNAIKQTLMSGAMMLALSLVFTSCDELIGELDNIVPNPVAPTPSPEPDPTPTLTPEPTMLETPLTFEAAEAGAQVIFNIVTTVATNEVQYSTDGEHWSTYTSGTAITLTNVGDKVMFRGTNATYAGPPSSTDNNSNFSCNKYCYIYGNIMSLIKAEGFETVTELTGTDNFRALFSSNIYIKNHTDASKYLVLPATKMTENCYRQMFYNCNALTTTPVLKVDCNSALGCMSKMFEECHNLATVAAGSEITGNMGSHACEGMFQNCPELKTVPSTFLPATTLAEGCYQSMFNGCMALEKAPKLPAETLVASCYDAMFRFCKSLNEVRVKAGYTTAGNACSNMFTGCTNASTSKFYTDGTWSDWKSAFSNINAWTTYPYAPGIVEGKFSVSATQKVCFSQGNLQYTKSTGVWSFMEHQWSTVETLNQNVGTNYAEQDVVSLFGWGTSGYNHGAICYQPYNTSSNYNDYIVYGSELKNLYDDSGKADWGYNKISNGGDTENYGWRTLTKDEWNFLFTRTPTSGLCYVRAKVNDVNGVILLPDDWSTSYYALSSTEEFTANVITSTDWTTKLEAHGAVFLPTAGYRSGSSVNNAGSNGHYWSSTNRVGDGWCLSIIVNYPDFMGAALFHCGFSVRLVRDVE